MLPAAREPWNVECDPTRVRFAPVGDATLANLRVAKLYGEEGTTASSPFVSNISYSKTGAFMIDSSTDSSMTMYDCFDGTTRGSCYSAKYGCEKASFLHNDEGRKIVFASTKVNHALRMMDTVETKFIRYFEGHTETVNNLSMNPVDDVILSSGKDNTVRIWDPRAKECVRLLYYAFSVVSGWDPSGMHVGVGIAAENTVRIYDIRMSNVPVSSTAFGPKPIAPEASWDSLQFSYCGNRVTVNTYNSSFIVFSPHSGNIDFVSAGRQPVPAEFASVGKLCTTWLPNSNYILTSNGDGTVWVVNIRERQISTILNPRRPNAVLGYIAFNPKVFMLATAGSQTALWTLFDEPEAENAAKSSL